MENRVYLYVPFEKKDEVKSLGARWDKEKKLWYSTQENIEKTNLRNYLEEIKKVYYNISFYEKDEAKRLGARWDKEKKMWYAMSDNKVFEKRYGKKLCPYYNKYTFCDDCKWNDALDISHILHCGGGGCKYIRDKYDTSLEEDDEGEHIKAVDKQTGEITKHFF